MFGPHPQIPTTIGRPTQALFLLVSKRVQLIVKGELSVGWNVFNGKNPNPRFPIDSPLLGFAVRAAAVVDEAGVVGLAAGIDHQVALKSEKVEVANITLLRLPEPF